jgi:imidazole glycerol-phosphate synthase subunit HisF
MLKVRVMPCLLLRNAGLVKTIQFKNPGYVGKPINAIRIYNEKEVDELIFLDITATVENKRPPFKIISEIANECFMPVAYGGGVRTLDDVKEIFSLGIEKVALNSYAVENPLFVRMAADKFGSQSIVVSIDAKRKLWGRYEVYTHGGRKATGLDPVKFAAQMQEMGAGEILLTSIDRDGTMQGYDLDLVKRITDTVNVPVIACGGAGKVSDFKAVVEEGGASAAAAGSMVVYFGRNRAVLVNFPEKKELEDALGY